MTTTAADDELAATKKALAAASAEISALRSDIAYVVGRDLPVIDSADMPARAWHAVVPYRHCIEFLRARHGEKKA